MQSNVRQRLRTELRQSAWIRKQDLQLLNQLPYLNAIVNEILRLCPRYSDHSPHRRQASQLEDCIWNQYKSSSRGSSDILPRHAASRSAVLGQRCRRVLPREMGQSPRIYDGKPMQVCYLPGGATTVSLVVMYRRWSRCSLGFSCRKWTWRSQMQRLWRRNSGPSRFQRYLWPLLFVVHSSLVEIFPTKNYFPARFNGLPL